MAVKRSLAAALLAAAGLLACRPPAPEPAAEPVLSITELLGGGAAGGFAQALAPRAFVFPDDHGPHPEFRTEWWYFTGNMAAGERRFGYQLTFFRNGLTADPPSRDSAWAAAEAYMAHFAVTDAGAPGAAAGFRSHERFARGAAGLAGAQASPFRVWLEDWSAAAPDATANGVPPIRLDAAAEGVAIELELAPGKPPVLQGERGLSRKGAQPGNASYYYSLTRLPTSGRIEIAGESHEARGLSWVDREWSTSVLEPGLVGWDWYALQLDDGSELMFYRLRRADGSADPASAGSLIETDGASRGLAGDEVAIDELRRWRSPRSGRTYPARWRLSVPSRALELEIEPLLADQELRHSFVYWEGAVRAAGSRAGEPVAGYGYVELTGY